LFLRLLLPLLLLSGGPAAAEALSGIVIRVADGDTITVVDGEGARHKIRLAGIDAPERDQPFGQRARQALAAQVFNRQVDIQWQRRDRYRRLVGKVLMADPACRAIECPRIFDAGLAQVHAGMAWWYRHYAAEQPADEARRYAEAEGQARQTRAGLWRQPEPHPPWDWRKSRGARRSPSDPGRATAGPRG